MADFVQDYTPQKTATSRLAELRIRLLEKADLPRLEWEGAFSHFRRLYEMAYWRSLKGNAALWVADLPEKRVVGQLFVLLKSEHDNRVADGRTRAFVHSFRVRPEYRDEGIGSLLLRHAEDDLMERQFRWVALNVARDNPGAIRFYERAAYERVGKEAGRWSYVDHLGQERHVHEPSWRMLKDLNGSH